jgi:hypothetical protein
VGHPYRFSIWEKNQAVLIRQRVERRKGFCTCATQCDSKTVRRGRFGCVAEGLINRCPDVALETVHDLPPSIRPFSMPAERMLLGY